MALRWTPSIEEQHLFMSVFRAHAVPSTNTFTPGGGPSMVMPKDACASVLRMSSRAPPGAAPIAFDVAVQLVTAAAAAAGVRLPPGQLDFTGFCVLMRCMSMAEAGVDLSPITFNAMARMPLPPPSCVYTPPPQPQPAFGYGSPPPPVQYYPPPPVSLVYTPVPLAYTPAPVAHAAASEDDFGPPVPPPQRVSVGQRVDAFDAFARDAFASVGVHAHTPIGAMHVPVPQPTMMPAAATTPVRAVSVPVPVPVAAEEDDFGGFSQVVPMQPAAVQAAHQSLPVLSVRHDDDDDAFGDFNAQVPPPSAAAPLVMSAPVMSPAPAPLAPAPIASTPAPRAAVDDLSALEAFAAEARAAHDRATVPLAVATKQTATLGGSVAASTTAKAGAATAPIMMQGADPFAVLVAPAAVPALTAATSGHADDDFDAFTAAPLAAMPAAVEHASVPPAPAAVAQMTLSAAESSLTPSGGIVLKKSFAKPSATATHMHSVTASSKSSPAPAPVPASRTPAPAPAASTRLATPSRALQPPPAATSTVSTSTTMSSTVHTPAAAAAAAAVARAHKAPAPVAAPAPAPLITKLSLSDFISTPVAASSPKVSRVYIPLPPLAHSFPHADIAALPRPSAADDELAIVTAISGLSAAIDTASTVLAGVQRTLQLNDDDASSVIIPVPVLDAADLRLKTVDELLTQVLLRLDSVPKQSSTAAMRRDEVRRATGMEDTVELARAAIMSRREEAAAAASPLARDLFTPLAQAAPARTVASSLPASSAQMHDESDAFGSIVAADDFDAFGPPVSAAHAPASAPVPRETTAMPAAPPAPVPLPARVDISSLFAVDVPADEDAFGEPAAAAPAALVVSTPSTPAIAHAHVNAAPVDDDDDAFGAPVAAGTTAPSRSVSQLAPPPLATTVVRSVMMEQVPATAPLGDDDDDFDAFASAEPPPAPHAAVASSIPPPVAQHDDDDFDAFETAAPAAPVASAAVSLPAVTSKHNAAEDDFDAFVPVASVHAGRIPATSVPLADTSGNSGPVHGDDYDEFGPPVVAAAPPPLSAGIVVAHTAIDDEFDAFASAPPVDASDDDDAFGSAVPPPAPAHDDSEFAAPAVSADTAFAAVSGSDRPDAQQPPPASSADSHSFATLSPSPNVAVVVSHPSDARAASVAATGSSGALHHNAACASIIAGLPPAVAALLQSRDRAQPLCALVHTRSHACETALAKFNAMKATAVLNDDMDTAFAAKNAITRVKAMAVAFSCSATADAGHHTLACLDEEALSSDAITLRACEDVCELAREAATSVNHADAASCFKDTPLLNLAAIACVDVAAGAAAQVLCNELAGVARLVVSTDGSSMVWVDVIWPAVCDYVCTQLRTTSDVCDRASGDAGMKDADDGATIQHIPRAVCVRLAQSTRFAAHFRAVCACLRVAARCMSAACFVQLRSLKPVTQASARIRDACVQLLTSLRPLRHTLKIMCGGHDDAADAVRPLFNTVSIVAALALMTRDVCDGTSQATLKSVMKPAVALLRTTLHSWLTSVNDVEPSIAPPSAASTAADAHVPDCVQRVANSPPGIPPSFRAAAALSGIVQAASMPVANVRCVVCMCDAAWTRALVNVTHKGTESGAWEDEETDALVQLPLRLSPDAPAYVHAACLQASGWTRKRWCDTLDAVMQQGHRSSATSVESVDAVQKQPEPQMQDAFSHLFS